MIPPYAPSVPDWMRQVAGAVNPAIFTRGTQATAGSVASIEWQREDQNPDYPVSALAGLWPTDKVYWNHAISAEFDATNSAVTTPFVSPSATLLLAAHNKGSDATVCSLQTICGVHASGKEASGINFITYSGPGLTNVKMKGLEIDLQPDTTTTIAEAFGIALNAFTKEIPGDAIYIEGVFGGNWADGVRIGKLNATTGAGLYAGSGSAMGSLVNSASGTFAEDAIVLSNTHKVRFVAASGDPMKMYVDSSNYGKLTLPANGLTLRDGTDTSNLIAFDSSGNIDLQAGGTVKFAAGLSSASATAGAATLPTNPVGFVTVSVGGTARKVPYYA